MFKFKRGTLALHLWENSEDLQIIFVLLKVTSKFKLHLITWEVQLLLIPLPMMQSSEQLQYKNLNSLQFSMIMTCDNPWIPTSDFVKHLAHTWAKIHYYARLITME